MEKEYLLCNAMCMRYVAYRKLEVSALRLPTSATATITTANPNVMFSCIFGKKNVVVHNAKWQLVAHWQG